MKKPLYKIGDVVVVEDYQIIIDIAIFNNGWMYGSASFPRTSNEILPIIKESEILYKLN